DERGVGRIGVSQQYVFREHPPGEALTQSLVHTQRVATEALTLVWSAVAGPAPEAEPPSSVAVVRQSSGAASTGWDAFLRVLVAISVALALLHLVPVPGLDGGRLLFLSVELARGRPVSAKVETLANTVGFLALAAAILTVAVAEVRRALPSSNPGRSLSPGAPALLDAGVAGVPTRDGEGTSGTGMVSDGGRPPPEVREAASAVPALDGGRPPSDAGGPTDPGSLPDAGGPPRDAGAADAG
ncbi:site-2 protease family protein, partial [Hyalangium sp.]|uniref:site-2 protease family protein n=1 Tax=Hyalangium sp. TaxID=2028555 RepID=UPI002D36D68B